MGQKNIIELNGQRYDAVSGALLGEVPANHAPKQATASSGQFIDGFVRPHHIQQVIKPTATVAVSTPKVATRKSTPKRTAAHPVAAHKPDRAKTLMRHTVKKPAVKQKTAIKAQIPVEMMAAPESAIVPKRSVAQVDPKRATRAQHVVQSERISRFVANESSSRPTPVPVERPAVAPAKRVEPVKTPAPMAQPKTDIFEAAIARANSHKQTLHQAHAKRSHRRLINMAAAVAAFVVIGGFLAYLNLPGIEVRVASMSAGFHAVVPGYKPVGYTMAGRVKNQGGKISVQFRSGDSGYTVSQQASDWDSQTLVENTPGLSNRPHQTVQSNGRIVYVYGNGTASWVNGGVRYDITGNAGLSTDELAAIAASM